jgi:hypothetical protein
MKTNVIILILVFLCNWGIGQKWFNTYGNYNEDDWFQYLIESYDNGYLICAGKDSYPNPIRLLKTDINGNLLWEKTYRHSQYMIMGESIAQYSSGETVMVGTIWVNPADPWLFISKVDACGNIIWCKVFVEDETIWDWGVFQDVIILENGDIVALAYLYYIDDYTDQIFLYYFDNEGELLWKKSYASKDNHPLVMPRKGKKLIVHDNGYMIVGDCYYPNPGTTTPGYLRPFFINIDSDFDELWILPFGLSFNIAGWGYDAIKLNDHVFMGTGSNGNETLLVFFNDQGQELNYNKILNEDLGNNIYKNVTSNIEKINDSLFITATPVLLEGSVGGTPRNAELIIDTSGHVHAFQSHPNVQGNPVLAKTYDGKFVYGCNYHNPNTLDDIYLYKLNVSLQQDTIYNGVYLFDSLCPYQIQTEEIDISSCLIITDIEDIPTRDEYYSGLTNIPVTAFPNPTYSNVITLEYQNTEHHHNLNLLCYNIVGQLIHSEKIYQHQGKSIINIHTWESGIYLALIYSNSQVIGKTKFIVK